VRHGPAPSTRKDRLPLARLAELSKAPLPQSQPAIRGGREELPDELDVQAALEAGEIGTWDWDLATGRMRWSARMFRNLRLEPTEDGDLYQRLLAAIHPVDRESVAATLAASGRRCGPVRLEARLARPDDEPRWIVFLGRTEPAANGTPARMHGITIDSTRRHKAEEMSAAALSGNELQLRELNDKLQELAERRHRLLDASRAQMQAIFDNSPDWLTLFRAAPDGRFVYADLNHATERAYGLRYEKIVGRTVEEILGPEQAQLPLRLMRECIRSGENQRYTARRTMAGVTSSIDVMFVRVPGEQLDGGYHIMATARDMTEHEHMQERLRRERLLFELIIENTSEGIIVVDNDMRHLVWNAAMERINTRPRGDVLGKTVFEVFPGFADHPVGDAWREALLGRRAEIRDYRFFSRGRGTEIVYDADFTPLYDQRGAIAGAICMLRETTERHRLEHLSKLETVAQLTGGVAHDFNNLLTAAMGCLDMILRESQGERVASLAETALRSIDRGGQLTQQLLAFARRQALRPVSANLNTLLAEIDVLIRRALGETIEAVVDAAPGLPSCDVDPAQFEAAVMNLVINARDAMPGGGRLWLITREVEAETVPGVDLRPGTYVAFTVEDDGQGMSPEVASRALEPFYTTKEIGKGSGLGLSTVYGFAKQSGGGLRLESEPGAGTRVTLYLPAAPSNSPDLRRDGAGEAPRRGAGSILVVEDDADVRDVSVEILRGLGYGTLVARDGKEALELLRRPGRIDLLFTDLVMPGGISGVALARQAQEMRPGLPVLLTTGYAGQEAAAADEFPTIPKPFRSAELGRAVARLIRPAP
jgi:PAS domain S-box-containing protein